MSEGVGDVFQKKTKYFRDTLPGGRLDIKNRPEPYKVYPDCKKTALPMPQPQSFSLHESLYRRKSIRTFSPRPLSVEHVSYLLWASTGIKRREMGYAFRTAPSAGALYPIETYLVINRVDTLEAGVYHYSIAEHTLEELNRGDFSGTITSAALGQTMCLECAVVFIWTAIFQRSKWKYKQRAYRYIYLDAGHIAQNLALASTSLGLGSCQIAALFDDEVNEILSVDGIDESVIYMSVIGHPL
jgi:SagB-type dehydrogenase family enzyme